MQNVHTNNMRCIFHHIHASAVRPKTSQLWEVAKYTLFQNKVVWLTRHRIICQPLKYTASKLLKDNFIWGIITVNHLTLDSSELTGTEHELERVMGI
jgi:hypothetical protein